MDELQPVYATAAVIVGYFVLNVATRRFDPFAPVWLYLVGYVQVYVVQAISYHDWAVNVRGVNLVTAANFRALWALLWFLAIYHLGPGRSVASALPKPPRTWSPFWIKVLSPPLILWGLYCSVVGFRASSETGTGGGEISLVTAFPFLLMMSAILLIVTGRTLVGPRPSFLGPGLACAGVYVVLWMFNGKRSHSLIAVLATICALYISRLRRPSWPVLFSTAFAGVLVVTVALGWRNDRTHERSLTGFVGFLGDFELSSILESLNVDGEEMESYETTEYGGFLLMMDTVPEKSVYDYGANYLRIFSTYIPRVIWKDKPLYGRTAWRSAWVEGSEIEREDDFASPAIGILGATQLNGGTVGTLIVIGAMALLLSTSYSYFRRYADVPWVQFWWASVFYNAWFMVVCDDPMVWFYFNWGFTGLPVVVLMWWVNRFSGKRAGTAEAGSSGPLEIHEPMHDQQLEAAGAGMA